MSSKLFNSFKDPKNHIKPGGFAVNYAKSVQADGKRKRANRDMKGAEALADRTMSKLTGYTEDERANAQGTINQISSLSDLFGTEANKNYLDTTEGKSFAAMIEEQNRKGVENLNNNAGQMGLTNEAYLAGLNNLNQREGSSMRDLVSGADARRNQLRGMQLSSLGQMLAGNNALLGNKTAIGGQAYNYGTNMYMGSQARNDAQSANNMQSLNNALSLFMMANGAPPVA